MKHKILLENRYGEKNYLVPIDKRLFQLEFENQDSAVQILYLDSEHTKVKAIYPSGGPMLLLGDKILKWKINEIYWDKGWFIKVKRDDLSSDKTK